MGFPKIIDQGKDNYVAATARLAEDLREEIDLEMSTRMKVFECHGDATSTKKCNAPLTLGGAKWIGIPSRMPAGTSLPIELEVTASSALYTDIDSQTHFTV